MAFLTITVDRARARKVAERLGGIALRSPHFVPRAKTAAGERRLADAYFAWVGICQQTRTFRGRVDGRWLRGSDYLAHRFCTVLDQDPERFRADALAALRPEALAGWLSEDGNPAGTTADRLEERTVLLNDLGARLLSDYEGQAANVLAASKGSLGGKSGVFRRLSEIRAYRDPVRKKSYLLIQLLRRLRIFEPVDPEALGLPVDYHLLRVFLRAGILRLGGDRATLLLAGGRMSPEEDIRLRQAGVTAGLEMARIAPLGHLDLALWMLGRNCCFYEHPPVCQTGPCQLSDTCSFLQASDLACGLECPLVGICAGSLDPKAASIREPVIETDLY